MESSSLDSFITFLSYINSLFFHNNFDIKITLSSYPCGNVTTELQQNMAF